MPFVIKYEKLFEIYILKQVINRGIIKYNTINF